MNKIIIILILSVSLLGCDYVVTENTNSHSSSFDLSKCSRLEKSDSNSPCWDGNSACPRVGITDPNNPCWDGTVARTDPANNLTARTDPVNNPTARTDPINNPVARTDPANNPPARVR